MQHCNYSLEEAMDAVKAYHNNTAKAYKDAMIKAHQKPGSQSKLRVLIITEVLALRMDLQDIDQLVIYRFPKNVQPATIW